MVNQKSKMKEMLDKKRVKEKRDRKVKTNAGDIEKKSGGYSSWKTGIFSLLIVAILLILISIVSFVGVKKLLYFFCMIVLAITGILAYSGKRYGWLSIEILFFILVFINFSRI